MKEANKKMKFQGILKNIEIDKSNKNLNRLLFEKKIFLLNQDCIIEELELLPLGRTILNNTIRVENPVYKINPEILKSILEIIKEDFSGYKYTIDALKSKIGLFLSKEEKIGFLNKELRLLVKKIDKKGYLTYFNNTRFPDLTFKSFLEFIILIGCPKIIEDYLTTNKLNLQHHINNSDLLFVSKGVLYYEKYQFITERIKELDSKSKGENDTFTPLPPLEQLCYVDKLRSRCLRNRFSSLDYKYQLKHLNNITGGRIYDEKLQLETLIELVDMDPSVFNDCLLENHSEYARRLKKITNSSLSNIRKKISLFLLPKPSVNKLDPDIYKKDLDKYNTAQEKISIATTNIEQYFF